MSTNEIVMIMCLLVSVFSKIFIIGLESNFKRKWLENLAVAAACCDFLVIATICDRIFNWGWFF